MHAEQRVHAIHEALPGAQPLARVQYTFTCEAALDVLWRVRHVTLDESLSQPYELAVDLLVDLSEFDADSLLASSCELSIDRDGLTRRVCGVVLRIELHDHLEDQQPLRVVVVPALRLLEQRVDARLWQGMSALAIAEEVLRAGLWAHGRELDTSHLRADYEPREFGVQLHESDLDFAARLLEDEGVAYHFDHERGTGREVLVLEDSSDAWATVPTLDDQPVLAIIATRPHQAEVESLQRLTWMSAVRPTTVLRRTFDWMCPTTPTSARAGEPPGREYVRELYHHGRLVESNPTARVVRELAHARAGAQVLRGLGNVIGLAPGRRFKVTAADRPELDQEYLVVRQHTHGDCPEVQLGERVGGDDYAAEFECVVLGADPWRPPLRTPKPKVHGPQTALVTGPEGEEIHTDEHGRIKVRFDWDRQHDLTDDSSVWIRVAQGWAGAGFGMLFVPRVGTEVVVEFLAGDPDRPLVIGCVYNPDSAASIPLPDAKTQSTIRSKSSPGGDGYNELRFEDAAGAEQILVHAQRNLCEQIGHDRTTTIANCRRETIGGAHHQTVRGAQTLIVETNRTEHVHGDADVTHDATRLTRIYGSDVREVYDRTIESHHTSCERRVTNLDETIVYRNEYNVAKARTLVEGDIGWTADREAKLVAGDRVELVQGKPAALARVYFEDGTIEQQAKHDWRATASEDAELVANRALELRGAKRVELHQDQASIRMANSTIIIDANMIKLKVGDNTLELTQQGLAVLARAVEMAAEGSVIVKSALSIFD